MKRKRKRTKPIPQKDFLSSGSTPLNLACTGNPDQCFYKGGYFLFCGDSDSGKSVLAKTLFAEAAKNKHFKRHEFINDDVEGGTLMDIEKFYGKQVALRMKPPSRGISECVEDFWGNLNDMYESGKPFIYLLDSMDGLDTEEDLKKFKAKDKARNSNEKTSGSYALSKPKLNSQGLRRAKASLKRSGSILIIIAQTRDNIGPGSQFNPKTRAGGRALKFYARLEIWYSIAKNLRKTVRGKQRQVGILAKLQIKKNHIIGGKSTVEIPIYNAFGVDDLGACINYLIDEKHWKSGKSIDAPEFNFKGTKEKLIKKIEDENLETEIKMLVAKIWDEIKEKSESKRKRRYV